jgi:hypothetical protein
MKILLRFSLAAFFALCVSASTSAQVGQPNISRLERASQLPQTLPQRVMGLAYDGENLWATIYMGRGTYGKFDPLTLSWTTDNEKELNRAIAGVARAFGSPGGLCFVNRTLWVVGSYGQSFGSINTGTWKVEKFFEGKRLQDDASQSYSSIACDGNYIWIAWHWYRYDLPLSQTQLILKIDPESGKIIAEYAAPGGTRNDGAAGLTWDGARLWYMKDENLSSIDPSTGVVVDRYVLRDVKRPSGLAWPNDALWISQFDGKIWRLPFGRRSN